MRTRPFIERITGISLMLVFLHPLTGHTSIRPTAEIQVEMTEFAFRPAVIRLTAGRPVRLTLINRGQIAHQLEAAYLHGTPVRVVGGTVFAEVTGLEFLGVQPGTQASMVFVPTRRGRFQFACTIEGHTEAGMRGLLDVR